MAVLATCLVSFALAITANFGSGGRLQNIFALGTKTALRFDLDLSNPARQKIIRDLLNHPGNHLVVVRVSPDHEPRSEWVYNDADIDNSRIVWARAMGQQDEELISYFKDRQVWLLDADGNPPKLTKYAAHPNAGEAAWQGGAR